jgi:glycosyltransferase involved in cell wall biosynthesis
MKIHYMLLHAYGMGGTIRTVINQANAMVADGHDVELVSVLRRRDDACFPIDDRVRLVDLVDLRRKKAPRLWRLHQHLAQRKRQALAARPGQYVPEGEYRAQDFNELVEQAVISYLQRLRGGVVVTTRPGLNLLAARFAPAGVVRVGQEHMNLASHRSSVQEAARQWYPQLDALVTLTNGDREEYQEFLKGTEVLCIPNAVHSLDQEPSQHTNKIVLAAGRLTKQKGYDFLIPAFAQVIERHPDWQLRIYGTGHLNDQVRRLINRWHLYNHVLLMGQTTSFDDELAKASLFVLSSRFEGLPMVMIEAMAHALPVVSFDCPTGPRDVLKDGVDGLLVPPKDVDALARALQRLVGDEPLRKELGAAAAKTAERYGPDAITPQWEALFRRLSAAASPRR